MLRIHLDYQEAWIYIDSNKTKYKICSSGNVFNTDTNSYMRGGRDKNGYHIISLTYNKKKYTRKIHRLVAEAFIPNPKNLPEVNHKDGDKWDNDIHNLEWVESYENTHHAQDIGLRPKSLDAETVIAICKLLETGMYSSKDISKRTGIKQHEILRIARGTRWRSISSHYDFSKFDFNAGYARGSSNGNSKLSMKKVIAICKLLESGMTPAKVSKKTKVSLKTVCDIRSKKTWKHVSSNFKF